MKKCIVTLMLLPFAAVVLAQNAYIPDPVFRAYISSIAPGSVTGDSLNTTDAQVTSDTLIDVTGLGVTNLEGVEYFTSLLSLKAASNSISVLPVMSNTVSYINVDSNVVQVVIPLPAALQYFSCNNNQIRAIDSLPHSIQYLNCQNNNLLCLPYLPNTLHNLLALGNFVGCLPNIPPNSFYSDIAYINGAYQVCAGGNCNQLATISGYAFNDLNHNGIKDANEPGLSNIIINIPHANANAQTDSAGYYTVNVYPGVFDTLYPSVINRSLHQPDSVVIKMAVPLADTSNVNFAYEYANTDSFAGIRVFATQAIPAVPCNISKFNMVVNNDGARTLQGKLYFVIDPSYTYVSSIPSGILSSDTVTWNFDSLYAGTNFYYNIILNTKCTDTLNEPFINVVRVFGIADDSLPVADSTTIQNTIDTSYPRTNKTVIPAQYSGTDFRSGKALTYTITFQNTGTRSSRNVWIIDTLNSMLDMGSLYVIAASAGYSLTVNGQALRIDFASINLPDSTESEPESHGFFTFSIKPDSGILFRGNLHNSATVYFDGAPAPPVGVGLTICMSSMQIYYGQKPDTVSFCGNSSAGSAQVFAQGSAPPFTYSWDNGSNDSIRYNLYYYGEYYVTVTDQCAQTAVAIVFIDSVMTGPCNVWMGRNNVWNDSTNWSQGAIPGCDGSDVYIPSGRSNYPELNADISAPNLVLLPGAYINLEGYELNVCGNLILPSDGGGITGSGRLEMKGSSQQYIKGTLKADILNINNGSAGVVLDTAQVTISGVLELQTGNLNIGAGSLLFTSTSATQQGIINNFSPGFSGTITGKVSAQRFYESGDTSIQHMIGSPLQLVHLSLWGAGSTSGFVMPTDSCSETELDAGSPYGKVFSCHESNGATCGLAQWYVEDGGSFAGTGTGYSVWLTGNSVFTLNGAPNLATSYTVPALTNSNWSNTTEQGRTLTSGWNLVSNPYLATLQPNSENPGIDNQIQVWSPSGPYTGSYQPGMVHSGFAIAPFQAYMVHVTAPGSASYTFNSTDLTTTPTTFYALSANTLDIIAANNTTGLLDKTTIAFSSIATDTFDWQYDAFKLSGALGRHTLYSINKQHNMAINTLHDVATTSFVNVGFEAGVSCSYQLSFGNINTFDATTYITLEDFKTNQFYNVRNGNYQFTANSSDDRNRFVIHFTPPTVINTTAATCNTPGKVNITQPGPADWLYVITDSNSNIVSSGRLNEASPVNLSLSAGNYQLSLTDSNNYTAIKPVIVNGPIHVTASFTSPAMATINTQILFDNTSQNADSYAWNFNDGVTSDMVNPVHAYYQAGNYTVVLNAINATGCSTEKTALIKIGSSETGTYQVDATGIALWSSDNHVFVNFTNAANVNASVKIYNTLGQFLGEARQNTNALFEIQINNFDEGYVIVVVNNDDKVTAKKLFISNY